MTARERFDDEQGLTLIELTIAIGVLAIIIVPIVSSFLLSLLESTSARERVADNSGAQLVSTYLLGDIQGSDTVLLGTAGCATSGTALLGLKWNDPSPSTPDTFAVDYVDVTGSDGQHQLHRMSCTNGGSPHDDLLAQNLKPSSWTVTCTKSDGTADATCAAAATVQVALTAQSIHRDTHSSYEPFNLMFTAARRTA